MLLARQVRKARKEGRSFLANKPRNELCACGSGFKYKKCCIEREKSLVVTEVEKIEKSGGRW